MYNEKNIWIVKIPKASYTRGFASVIWHTNNISGLLAQRKFTVIGSDRTILSFNDLRSNYNFSSAGGWAATRQNKDLKQRLWLIRRPVMIWIHYCTLLWDSCGELRSQKTMAATDWRAGWGSFFFGSECLLTIISLKKTWTGFILHMCTL